jgi:hypothetical protein
MFQRIANQLTTIVCATGLITALAVCPVAAQEFRVEGAVAAGTQLVSPGPVIGRAGTPRRFTMTKKMVFVSEIKGNYEIYIMREDGTEGTNLTNDPHMDMEPRLSPDATRIVFQTHRDGNGEIYSMKTDGTDLRNLTNNPDEDLRPAWSPDGLRIVFQRGPDTASELYTMNADGSGQTVLTRDVGSKSNPAWSPDGRWVVYVSRNAVAAPTSTLSKSRREGGCDSQTIRQWTIPQTGRPTVQGLFSHVIRQLTHVIRETPTSGL